MTTTRTRRISVADVRGAMAVVAAEDPDHSDRRAEDDLSPRYIVHGQPSCLVARVLEQLGFSRGVLRDLDRCREVGDWRKSNGGGARIGVSWHPALKKIDPAARQLLEWVQSRQDRGQCWGFIADQAFKKPRWGRRERKPWVTDGA